MLEGIQGLRQSSSSEGNICIDKDNGRQSLASLHTLCILLTEREQEF